MVILEHFHFFQVRLLEEFGDGGCIITNNSKVYKNLTKIKNHGQKNLYDHEING